MRYRSKLVVLLMLCLGVGGCASGGGNPANICSLLKENRSWVKDARRAQKRWGLPTHVGFAFVYRESSFNAKAKPPRKKLLGVVPLGRESSAYGYAQATDEAWKDYRRATKKRLVQRDDFGDALDFIGWYNSESHRRLGLSKWDTYNLYLAYYSGHGGYARGHWKKSASIKGYANKTTRQAGIYARQLKRCPI